MNDKIIANNKKAFFNYEIEENLECGICLLGSEVKSIRAGNVSFNDAFVRIKDNEFILSNLHVAEYKYSNILNHEEKRDRKLLAHKKEIFKWKKKIAQKGYSIVPLKIYFKKGKIKAEIGLGRGKKHFDKRESIKQKDLQREVKKEFKNKLKF